MNVAFIPVRGGSKSIPLKNIKPISGRPLVYWTVKAACGCKYIDKVFVATDSDKIKETVEGFKEGSEAELFKKAEVIGRSAESASDTASTEFAMLEFADKMEFDNIVLVQATSPLLVSSDLDRGFEAFGEENVDSVLSVVRQKRFHWGNDENGFAHPTNYDVFHRPRRQEFDGYLVENGAFYISSKEDLLKSKNRVSGNIKAVEMNEDTFFEIDEPSDWVIIEALMKKNDITAPKEIPEIKMFLTDCDGCLTDGGMYYSEHGDEQKKFNTRDGMGFALLRNKGIVTGIVTSENVDLNRRRAQKLKLDVLEAGCKDKVAAVKTLCEKYNVSLENVAYIGDDINDLDVIKMVGYGCCPADAMPQVRDAARYVTKAKGGEGVIREIVEAIINDTN
ncbi:N-acylneuraminate cytidylyltransferase [Enterocloster clostridioformis]|uniref:N-acylneuraminate cytidylyltransferase n=1 Tax=Enterocloster clostridioformis TaxID=1531 RepID=A0A2X2USS5_9FIRM|nr:N-acylneuraminate cytidylyltransferase [Enterocloster clostridioformis]MCA5580417.1 N-acylneuraminate cytidylyltransferase [Enterocloster clostridioformis]SQB16651.1 cytidylyltransferase domain-containing protein [Enterocloster clostridioformis]